MCRELVGKLQFYFYGGCVINIKIKTNQYTSVENESKWRE